MKVISFEGFEYSGKSTQIKLLKKYFIKNNIKSTFTREPGGNKDLEKIRNVILKSNFDNLSLIMFFFASRFALLSSIKKNDFIVFDRFFDSTYAYQKYNSKEKKLKGHWLRHPQTPNLVLKRFGNPEEVAEVIVNLCKKEASYINGQTLHVNGGSYTP